MTSFIDAPYFSNAASKTIKSVLLCVCIKVQRLLMDTSGGPFFNLHIFNGQFMPQHIITKNLMSKRVLSLNTDGVAEEYIFSEEF